MRRGAKALETRRRRRVWSGGSRKIIIPSELSRLFDMISSTVPWAEL